MKTQADNRVERLGRSLDWQPVAGPESSVSPGLVDGLTYV